MQNNKKKFINEILNLIDQFLDGNLINLDENLRRNPFISHYFNEIIRFWSKINFIFQKTHRSIESFKVSKQEQSLYMYLVYRVIFEKSSSKKALDELNLPQDNITNFELFVKKLKSFSWKKALVNKSEIEKLSIKEAIPQFVIDRLLPVMSLELIKKNIYYLNNLNKFDNFVRYNALKNEDNSRLTIEILKKDFEKDKISIQQDREIPELFLISKTQKSKILKSKWYQSGKLIFQDKASAAVVKVLDPKPNDYICDMCAAPGNKTSLIAQFSNNQAKIIANEFRKDRSFSTKQLLLELNVSNCHLINTDSINPPIRTTQQFDKILLDAPCTGSGTLLTNPELKWRQNRGFLYQNITLQEKLLHSALKLLKPEGILVYSTCSLYPEEGEQQIIKILEHLIPLDLPEWFSPSYKIKGKEIPGIGRLHPLIHRTQGFFIGKFKKRN